MVFLKKNNYVLTCNNEISPIHPYWNKISSLASFQPMQVLQTIETAYLEDFQRLESCRHPNKLEEERWDPDLKLSKKI